MATQLTCLETRRLNYVTTALFTNEWEEFRQTITACEHRITLSGDLADCMAPGHLCKMAVKLSDPKELTSV